MNGLYLSIIMLPTCSLWGLCVLHVLQIHKYSISSNEDVLLVQFTYMVGFYTTHLIRNRAVFLISIPMNISTKKLATNSQKAQRINGRNCDPRTREVSTNGIASRIRRELNIASTPNSLFGIDRKMA